MKTNTVCFFLFLLFFQIHGIDRSHAQPSLEFSNERGFYQTSFELIIQTDVPGSTIRYSLDGSNPLTGDNYLTSVAPVNLTIHPYLTEGRAITPGVIVRACAINNSDTSEVETHSYIFLDEVKYQSQVSPALAPYWPDQEWISCTYPPTLIDWMRFDYQNIDLGVDPEVVHKPEYQPVFEEALLNIPTLSLVTDPENLFSETTGIYRNAIWPGISWERAGSLELLNPVSDGFQVNTGIRIRGGWSCRGDFPKHGFRLFFRKEYGDGKLDFPLFGDEGTDQFDKIDLRCSQNNSWHVPNGNRYADFIRDLFAREMQGDMGQPYTRSEYYHLYVNGMYWGLFQTQERAEARFAESYLGGSKEDYDVVKSSGPSTDYPPYTLEATDGNLNSSYALWQIAKQGFTPENYNRARGFDPDGTTNPAYPKLLDEISLIDYIIVIYFSGNQDGPASLSQYDTRINNFFGIYDRTNPDGFKYFIHDNESSFFGWNDDITGIQVAAGEEFSAFNPMWLHQRLLENEDYRQTFADRAYKHLFNDGALTVQNNIDRYVHRSSQISNAIIGESARWGDVRTNIPYTKNDTWLPYVTSFTGAYLPARTDEVISQFTERGWLNGILPPAFNTDDFDPEQTGVIGLSGTFELINPNSSGEIYYTTDNSDPRDPGGAVSGDAVLYTVQIPVNATVFLKTRVREGENWSPLAERVILATRGDGLILSEINYNPVRRIIGPDTIDSKMLEFIEFKNNSGDDFDISGFRLVQGVEYTFPVNTWIDKDSLVVVASDTAAFRKLYGFKAFGPFSGNLNNAGETIILVNAAGEERINVDYNLDGIWYQPTDGEGYTLVYSDYEQSQLTASEDDWRISTLWQGSPGKDDPEPSQQTIRITEILANSEYPQADAIELYNPTLSDIDIGNWFLSDQKDRPDKWTIPAGTLIPAGGYKVFLEGHYVSDTLRYAADEFGGAFSISSAGERILLCSGDTEGKVLCFVAGCNVEPTLPNISFGDFVSTSGDTHQVMLESVTLGADNAPARQSPVVISTIMYHPPNGNVEYLVLRNRTDSVVDLFHAKDSTISWEVDGTGFRFPPAISLDPGDSLYLVEKNMSPQWFREAMNLTPGVMVFNFPGTLRNSSEKISLQCPVLVSSDTSDRYALATLEGVEYADDAPWPAVADGAGPALLRKDQEAFADDYSNWTTILKTFPAADAGNDMRVRTGSLVSLDGSESEDPEDHAVTYEWTLITRPAGSTASLNDPNSVSPDFTADAAGDYTFALRVDNGSAKSAPSLVSIYAQDNRAPVAGTYPTTYRTAVGESVNVMANGCYDYDYDLLNYSWVLVEWPDESVPGGDTYSQRTFSFTPDAEGTFRFELSVDDGELYSNVISVRVIASPAEGIEAPVLSHRFLAYPNPVTEEMNLDFSLGDPSDVKVSLATLEGKLLFEEVFNDQGAGLNHLAIGLNGRNIRPGIYLVILQAGDFRDVRRIAVMP